MNQPKILFRSSSRHYTRKHYQKRDCRPLPERIEDHLRNSKNSEHRGDITRSLGGFRSAFQTLESTDLTKQDDIIQKIGVVIQNAHVLLYGDSSGPGLYLKYRQLHASAPKVIHELQKLAHYWEVCLVFSRLARSFRTIFSHLTLVLLDPPTQESFARHKKFGKIQRHIHAEMQLIGYHESHGSDPWPRVIASSKSACFLCYEFIQAHGILKIHDAHRQVANQWTFPESKRYNGESIARISRALETVNQMVLQESKMPRTKNGYPKQSKINLAKFHVIPTPSATTIYSERTSSTAKTVRNLLKPWSMWPYLMVAQGSDRTRLATRILPV